MQTGRAAAAAGSCLLALPSQICLTAVTDADRRGQGHVLLCKAPGSHLCSTEMCAALRVRKMDAFHRGWRTSKDKGPLEPSQKFYQDPFFVPKNMPLNHSCST